MPSPGFEETKALMEKVMRERVAFELSYLDLQAEVDAHEKHDPPEDPEEAFRELAMLIMRLTNHVNLEREQNAELFGLLTSVLPNRSVDASWRSGQSASSASDRSRASWTALWQARAACASQAS